jgi:SWI/SNF-related matrix-associated actin-dependent regulator of chromatin subfamily A member 5
VYAWLPGLLRPFLLRRLKAEVERGIPPKKELTVYCKLTPEQITTYKAILKNNVDVLNSGSGATGSRVKLMNTMMQLRKACNHPYLFDGVEDKSLDPFGEHLITHSGKLVLLDKLLPRLQMKGSRVLIFSQITR